MKGWAEGKKGCQTREGRGDKRHEGNGFPLEDEEWIWMTEVAVKREI